MIALSVHIVGPLHPSLLQLEVSKVVAYIISRTTTHCKWLRKKISFQVS